eukprot:g1132.t1
MGRACAYLALAAVLLGSVLPDLASARPTVREIRNNREFERLIKHHKEMTGLPVIVDYYSDGCGPCRQIAPHFKRLAKKYKNKAVFAKVNVDRNRETSSRQQIRSMPTFQAYLLGKKRQQFSGADLRQLQSISQQLSYEAAKYDVELTKENLVDFYKGLGDRTPHGADDGKAAAQAEKILEKCGEGGPRHYKMSQRLKKKYGTKPATIKWSENSGAKGSKKGSGKPSKKTGKKNKPNLHLASMEELMAELEVRREREEEEKEKNGTSTDGDAESDVPIYKASPATERIVVVGAGPAGLAAAVYAARAGLKPVVIAPLEGGQLQGKGVLVENFPGVAGVTGPVIVHDMRKQAAEFGTRFHEELVKHIDIPAEGTVGGVFTVRTESATIKTHTVIMATGADSRWLGAEGEYEFRGGGVSSCATCDGFLFRDKPVVVIGGGDTAMEDAMVLSRTSSKVTVIHRRDSFRASHILAKRVLENPKVDVKWNTTVEAFLGKFTKDGEPLLTHVRIRDKNTGSVVKFQADGAFVAIGHDPNTKVLDSGDINMDEGGYIITQADSCRTSVPGIFAAGDVADRVYRQAITSAGSGAMAALDAERWLSEHGINDVGDEASASKTEL